MTPAEQRYANEAWEMSDKAYVDGIELLHLIELLQRQNTGVVNDKLNAAGAGDAANFIRNAILSRIVLFVAGAYAPARRGDLHLKRAFDLLKCPAVFHELGLRGSPKLLDEAKELWTKCSANDARLAPIKHFRDKFTAHSSEPIKDIRLPPYIDLFGFARDTMIVMDKFARGTGARTEPLSDWQPQAAESSEQFWSIWEKN